MTSIRKFIYAGLLAFTTLNLMPNLASAQEPANGQFTLSHDVHWQNAMVPAGDYKFSLEPEGAFGVLTLSKTSGVREGFVFLVDETDEAKATDSSRLFLQSTSAGSYARAMQLPRFGITLHFTVPSGWVPAAVPPI